MGRQRIYKGESYPQRLAGCCNFSRLSDHLLICYCAQAMDHDFESDPSLQQLYPTLSPEELRAASENIDRYLGVILRLCKRLEADSLGSPSGADKQN